MAQTIFMPGDFASLDEAWKSFLASCPYKGGEALSEDEVEVLRTGFYNGANAALILMGKKARDVTQEIDDWLARAHVRDGTAP